MKKLIGTFIISSLMGGVAAFASGGNIGSSGKTTAFLIAKCNTAVGRLGSVLREDQRNYRHEGTGDESEARLVRGLEEARELLDIEPPGTPPTPPSPDDVVNPDYSLVRRAIQRTLEIYESLKEVETLTAEHRAEFLRSSYRMITQEVAFLDTGLHITYGNQTWYNRKSKSWHCKAPYNDRNGRTGYADCDQSGLREWENQFTRFGVIQINFLMDNFTTRGKHLGTDKYLPVGSPSRYFNIASSVAANVAKDLEDSLWSEAYTCAVQQLKDLSDALTRYTNDAGGFKTDPEAVMFSVEDLLSVRSSLSEGCNNGSNQRNGPRRGGN